MSTHINCKACGKPGSASHVCDKDDLYRMSLLYRAMLELVVNNAAESEIACDEEVDLEALVSYTVLNSAREVLGWEKV